MNIQTYFIIILLIALIGIFISMLNYRKRCKIYNITNGCPSKHSLVKIFSMLKYGRPANDQIFLTNCIKSLKKIT